MSCFHCYTSFKDQAISLASSGGSGKGHTWIVLFPLRQMPSDPGPPFFCSFKCSGLEFLLLLEWSSDVDIQTFVALRAMLGEA